MNGDAGIAQQGEITWNGGELSSVLLVVMRKTKQEFNLRKGES